MEYKLEEIKSHALENLKDFCDYDSEYIKKDEYDIHHDLFNTDYYIVGIYEAKKWLGNKAFDVIEHIKEYEQDNFGEVNTDFSNVEDVVNMYAFIIGEKVLSDVIEEVKDYYRNK